MEFMPFPFQQITECGSNLNLNKPVPYSWWVVILTTIAMLGDGVVVTGIPVLYPFIRDELGLTSVQVGLMISSVMATSMLT
jgi:hypothetical protein